MAGLEQRVGRRVADARKRAGLTQATLAERVEVATETISRLERGKTLPSVEKLDQIARAVGQDVAEFFRVRDADVQREGALDRLVAALRPYSARDIDAIRDLASRILSTWTRR